MSDNPQLQSYKLQDNCLKNYYENHTIIQNKSIKKEKVVDQRGRE